MNRPNLDSPAGKGPISRPAGKTGALAGTSSGGFAAKTPSIPKTTTPLTVRIAGQGK